MRRWSLLLLVALAACGGDGECPLIGCVSQLTVQLPPDVTSARACVEQVCSAEVVDGKLQVPLGRRGDGPSVPLTVEVTGADGAVSQISGDAAVQRNRPNGEGCPPVCVVGTVRIDGERLVAVPPDAAGPASS